MEGSIIRISGGILSQEIGNDFSAGSLAQSSQDYQASQIGAQSFTYVKGEPFIPYADTEAFEAVVIGWLEGVLDVSSMAASIASQIQKQITPVNEDLYFTWQNPPIPPVPPVEEQCKFVKKQVIL